MNMASPITITTLSYKLNGKAEFVIRFTLCLYVHIIQEDITTTLAELLTTRSGFEGSTTMRTYYLPATVPLGHLLFVHDKLYYKVFVNETTAALTVVSE